MSLSTAGDSQWGSTGVPADAGLSILAYNTHADFAVPPSYYTAAEFEVALQALNSRVNAVMPYAKFTMKTNMGHDSVRFDLENRGTKVVRAVFTVGAYPPTSITVGSGADSLYHAIEGVNVPRFTSYTVKQNADYNIRDDVRVELDRHALPVVFHSGKFHIERLAKTVTLSVPPADYTQLSLAEAYMTAISATPLNGKLTFMIINNKVLLTFPPQDTDAALFNTLVGTNERLGITATTVLPAWARPTLEIPDIAFAERITSGSGAVYYTAPRTLDMLPIKALYICSPTLTHRSVCTMGARYHADIIGYVPLAGNETYGSLVEWVNPVAEFEPWTSARTISDIQIRLLDEDMNELEDEGDHGHDCMILLEFLTIIH
jgi:hypothetical protein